MLSSVTFGSDLNFSEEALVTMHNSELADILGNLVHRVLTLCVKYCDGEVPDCAHDSLLLLPFDLAALKSGVKADLKGSCINTALFKAMVVYGLINNNNNNNNNSIDK
jgi:methionyl-tRNA synthetase